MIEAAVFADDDDDVLDGVVVSLSRETWLRGASADEEIAKRELENCGISQSRSNSPNGCLCMLLYGLIDYLQVEVGASTGDR